MGNLIVPFEGCDIIECDTSDHGLKEFGSIKESGEAPSGPESYYVYENDDGTNSVVVVAFGKLPPRWSKSSQRPVRVDRLPGPFESWDRDSDCWVKDERSKVDFECGKDHITYAHILKRVEAYFIRSGVFLEDFILVKESHATGVPVQQLAESAIEHSSRFVEKEIARRVVKSSG